MIVSLESYGTYTYNGYPVRIFCAVLSSKPNKHFFHIFAGILNWRPLRATDPQVLLVLISLTITGYKCQVFLYGYTSAVRIEPITSRWLSPQNFLEPIRLTVMLLVFFVVYDSGLNYQPHFPLMHLSILLIAWPWIVWQGKTTVKLQIFYIYMYDIQ